MEIAYFGLGCFRLKGREKIVVIDVSSEQLQKALTKNAPVVLVDTFGKNDPKLLRVSSGTEQRVAGAGEFEVGGIEVKGFATGNVTTMVITIDDVRCVSLGMTDIAPDDSVLDALGHVDVLFVPTGGDGVLTAQDAVAVVRQIEPAIAIPMYYRVEGSSASDHYDDIALFAKESGLEEVKPLGKLSVTPTSSADELTTATVVLEAQR